MLSIVDDYSRRVCLYFMKHKSNVFKTFKERKIMIEKQANKHIKKLRTGEFEILYRSEGIVRYYTVSGTPQQNGMVERMNRAIMEKVLHVI